MLQIETKSGPDESGQADETLKSPTAGTSATWAGPPSKGLAFRGFDMNVPSVVTVLPACRAMPAQTLIYGET